MDVLYLLVPLSVVLVFVIGALFWWAVRSGQFDDMEGPAHRILMDDDSPVARADSRLRAMSAAAESAAISTAPPARRGAD